MPIWYGCTMRLSPSLTSKGFTLLEIVAVLALISIFAVLALVQHATSDASLTAQAQILGAHIRYAQMRCLNSDIQWGIYYHHGAHPSDRYYTLYHGQNPANTAVLPGQSDVHVPLGKMNIIVESSAGAGLLTAQDFQLTFDDWGSPESILAGTTSAETVQLRLNKTGFTPQDITITKNTGFIP